MWGVVEIMNQKFKSSQKKGVARSDKIASDARTHQGLAFRLAFGFESVALLMFSENCMLRPAWHIGGAACSSATTFDLGDQEAFWSAERLIICCLVWSIFW